MIFPYHRKVFLTYYLSKSTTIYKIIPIYYIFQTIKTLFSWSMLPEFPCILQS